VPQVGSIGQAGLITLASVIAVSLALDPMALSWWLVPAVLLPALLLVRQIRPDPRDIARNLDDYYPVQQASATALPGSFDDHQAGNLLAYVKDFTKLSVFVSMFGVHGNMFMTMVVTALTLADHGHGLPAIGASSTLHALGMFAFTIPQGWVSDHYGRRPVMLAGLPLAALGTVLIGLTGDYWVVTLGYFLVGFGWSAVNVAGTALLADVSHPQERARVIGSGDTFAGAANILLALVAGPALGLVGMPAIGAIGIALMMAPLVMVLRLGRTSGAPESGSPSSQL